MIEAIESDSVNVWRTFRGRSTRILIAAGDFSYVVILDDRADYVLLWTAYFVEHEHRRKRLASEYRAWKEDAKEDPKKS